MLRAISLVWYDLTSLFSTFMIKVLKNNIYFYVVLNDEILYFIVWLLRSLLRTLCLYNIVPYQIIYDYEK